MTEDESTMRFSGADAPEPLTDIERAIVSALRANMPVDAEAFDASVMNAVRREPAFAGARRRRSFRGFATLSASVAALAVIALFVTIGSGGITRSTHTAHDVHSALKGVHVATRTIRFTLVASGASHVVVAGSFNGWNVASTPMRRVGKDTWFTDIPLGAGRYEYQFVIDGNRWIADPRAPRDASDDFGATNSVVTVPVPGSA
jgi:hypothetical protein